MIDSAQFKSAMSLLGAAVNIITTDGDAGRHGMTASAVCSVSDDPASLLVCVNRSSRMNAAIAQNGQLCVNVLTGGHEELSSLFANRHLTMNERFECANWDVLAGGVPALAGALCNFACSIASVAEMGTHSVFFCHVNELLISDGADGLIYFGRNYHRVPLSAAA